jgi:hypothetical protein
MGKSDGLKILTQRRGDAEMQRCRDAEMQSEGVGKLFFAISAFLEVGNGVMRCTRWCGKGQLFQTDDEGVAELFRTRHKLFTGI